MRQDGRTRIFGIEEFVKKQMDRNAKRPEGEITDILCEIEKGECDAE